MVTTVIPEGSFIMSNIGFWERNGEDEMTRGSFFLVIGAVLSLGMVATYIVANLTVDWRPSILVFLGVGLGLPLVGIFMSALSNNAFVSLVGFGLVVVPFGATLGPVLAITELAQPGIISEAAMLTAAVTAVMAISGLLFPDFYRSIGGALFGALTALVVVYLIALFVPALSEFGIIHYIAAGIFALYIGYDMHRAASIPATLDNAVDTCVHLYLDIINLFLSILQILGNSDDD